MDAVQLKSGLQRWAAAMTQAAPELNALDGQLGDGDLGATLGKCAANVDAALATMPDSLDGIFKACAQACAKASGSSFGTLLAQGFLVAAKSSAGRSSLAVGDIPPLLDQVVDALAARGGARLGNKTMLDSLSAVARALEGPAAVADPCATAVTAAQSALDEFRGRPNQIGRARMFEAKSVGLDDPGMVAVLRMAQSL